MVKFLCVVRYHNGVMTFEVPSIRPLLEKKSVTVEEIPHPVYGVMGSDQEGMRSFYEVSLDDKVTVEVVSHENIHPSEWSSELRQLNHSFE